MRVFWVTERVGKNHRECESETEMGFEIWEREKRVYLLNQKGSPLILSLERERERVKPHTDKKKHSSACVLALPGFIFNVVFLMFFVLFIVFFFFFCIDE